MQKIYIQIPEPCHEDWSKMTPVEKGRYCDSCCKEVVDFSIMTDREIIGYLSKPRGKTCGNFLPEQLNRAIAEPQPASKKWGWGVVFSFLVTLAGACKQKAGYTVGVMKVEPTERRSVEPEDTLTSVQLIPGDMKGEVVMAPAVTVGVMNMAILQDEERPMAITQLPALDTIVPAKCNFDMISKDPVVEDELLYMAGGVSIIREEPVTVEAKTIVDTIKNIFLPAQLKLYPNPASKGSRVNVQISTISDYQVMLSDSQSRIITQSAFSITQKNQAYQLDIPSTLAGGIYYVIITDKRSKKQYTEKLIIQ